MKESFFDQIESYLDPKKFLYKFQTDFIGKYSTGTCLTHLTDFIKFQMDHGHFVGMVLLDLQIAYDTVDHGILLIKLKALGLSQDVSRWFWSYLSDRQQLVDVSGTLSSYANISCGVPQGSILGPLFIFDVNDISSAVSNKLLLYTDEYAILVADRCLSNIETVLQNEIVSE